MSYDLFLTNNGDITFFKKPILSDDLCFEYSFYTAPTDSLCLNFYIEDAERTLSYPDCFIYNFYSFKPVYDKHCRTVSGDEYIQQVIRIRLSTELGTLRHNENIGSMIHTFVHSNLEQSKLLDAIAKEVKNVLIDVLPNCTVTVKIENTDYLNYHDSIQIVIKDNEKIYYYSL